MIRFAKFRQELFGPVPGQEIYHKPGKGKGWPEECPPIRAANAFGFDMLANFDLDFRYVGDTWVVKHPLVIESDFVWAPDPRSGGLPLTQEYAWFWQKGQTLPHVITDNVYEVLHPRCRKPGCPLRRSASA